MKKYTIYKHTSPSNKIYIGITCQSIKRRWRDGKGYKSQKYFYRAIEKYGWDNFQHEILYENLEKEQAKILEMSLIHYYNSTNPKLGYNLTKGGEGSLGYSPTEETRKKLSETHKGKVPWNKGKTNIFSEEARKKMSEASRGRKLSEDAKKKISEANKGNKRTEEEKKKISEKAKERYKNKENNPMYGKNHSEETKKKLSESHKGKNVGKNNGKARMIICISTMTIFDCIAQGALFYGIKSSTNITKCCKGKIKFCGLSSEGVQLVWRYLTIIEL